MSSPETNIAATPATTPAGKVGESRNGRWVLPAIAATSLLITLPLCIWGYGRTLHDFHFHINTWMEAAHQWRHGVWYPRWAEMANFGHGEPRFIFYPPLSWMLGAGLSLFLPWRLVPGAYIYIALFIAGISMYRAAREFMPAREATTAAVVYVANPYHLMLVYMRWAAAEMLVSAMFPLLVLFACRMQDNTSSTKSAWNEEPSRSRRAVFPLAIVFALIWLTNAPGAVISSYTLVTILAALAVYNRSKRPLVCGGAAIALGLALAAFFVLPAAWEQRWVNIQRASVVEWFRPETNFLTLFPKYLKRMMAMMVANALIVNLVAVVVVLRRRKLVDFWWIWVLLAALASVLMVRISNPVWQYAPKMNFVQFPWRWLFVLDAALAFMMAALLPTVTKKLRTSIQIITVVLLFTYMGVARAAQGDPGKVAKLTSDFARAGYQGAAEYQPHPSGIGSKLSEKSINVLDNSFDGAPIRLRRLNAETIFLESSVSQPTTVRVPVLWYPAWRGELNALNRVPLHEDAGQVALTIPPGPNTVRIYFARTRDRLLGSIISLLALVAFAFAWIIQLQCCT